MGAFLKQSLLERGGEGEDEVTRRLREVLSDQDIHDMDMKARQEANMTIEMAALGNDDDFGNNDGDEGF